VPEGVLRKIRRSIEEFGFVENLVARPHPSEKGKLEVLSGNHRLLLLEEMHVSEVPVVVVELGDADARILAQALNRTRGEDDPEAYARLLESVLGDVGYDHVLEFLPETESSIDRLLREFAPVSPVDPDDVPPLPEEPRSKLGEVYELGSHRLMCGDATSAEHMARLMEISLASVLWTDPPYGVSYVGKTADALTLQGDSANGLCDLLVQAFGTARRFLEEGAPFYLAAPAGPRHEDFLAAVKGAGWELHETLVWVKDVFVLGHSDYHYKHEPILYGYMPGPGRSGRGSHEGTRWYGDHAQTTVFEVPRPKRSTEHPTMKPVELVRRMLQNSSCVGGIVLDPFAGSGSTLLAAEMTGRNCFAMEIDPAYCDVIRDRYERFSVGKTA
jgi:DNA modification methylase